MWAHLDGAGIEEEVDDFLLGGRLGLVQEGHAILQRMPQRPVPHLGQVRRQVILRQLRSATHVDRISTASHPTPNMEPVPRARHVRRHRSAGSEQQLAWWHQSGLWLMRHNVWWESIVQQTSCSSAAGPESSRAARLA